MYNTLRSSILLSACLFTISPGAGASEIVAMPGVAYRVDLPMLDNLRAFKGQQVTLHLLSGTQLSGTVKAVHRNLVHLERISQREFMDALIRLDQIGALESRFRIHQRDLQRSQK